MTDSDKELLIAYRNQGKGYVEISRLLNLSLNTVKSYCRRNAIVSETPVTVPEIKADSKGRCKQCGTSIQQMEHHREKQFCSDKCRMQWWHTHRDTSRSAKEHICPGCQRPFKTDRIQKYCSHECYILSRFGKESV